MKSHFGLSEPWWTHSMTEDLKWIWHSEQGFYSEKGILGLMKKLNIKLYERTMSHILRFCVIHKVTR